MCEVITFAVFDAHRKEFVKNRSEDKLLFTTEPHAARLFTDEWPSIYEDLCMDHPLSEIYLLEIKDASNVEEYLAKMKNEILLSYAATYF